MFVYIAFSSTCPNFSLIIFCAISKPINGDRLCKIITHSKLFSVRFQELLLFSRQIQNISMKIAVVVVVALYHLHKWKTKVLNFSYEFWVKIQISWGGWCLRWMPCLFFCINKLDSDNYSGKIAVFVRHALKINNNKHTTIYVERAIHTQFVLFVLQIIAHRLNGC